MTASSGLSRPSAVQYFFATVSFNSSGGFFGSMTTRPDHWHCGSMVFFPSIHCDKRREMSKTLKRLNHRILSYFSAPSTLIRFQTKTELFCSGYGHRPHYNAENGAIRKRSPEWSDLKTMLFENAVF